VNARLQRSVRSAALAVAFGSSVAALAYAVFRAAAFFATHEPDPALVIWSEHAGFYWRSTTAIFAGVLAGLAAAISPEERIAKLLAPTMMLSAALLALQALFIP
jgi:hypothetical protein